MAVLKIYECLAAGVDIVMNIKNILNEWMHIKVELCYI